MNNWNIKQRLLFLAIAPLFVTVVIMSLIHTLSRVQQFEEEFDRKGKALAKQLAITSEFAILSGNTDSIPQSVEAILSEKDVIRIKLADAGNNVLLGVDHSHTSEHDKEIHKYTAEFRSPITRSLISINDDFEQQEELTSNKVPVIGYAYIYLSRNATITDQRQVLLESIIVTILALAITTYIALLMARRLSTPLHKVTSTVARISTGDYDERIPVSSGGELGQLEQGVNSLAEVLHKAKEEDRNKTKNLEEANRQLQEEIESRKRIETELIDAKEHAEAANLAKSEFLANMGHELRTPLNSIIGFNELLLMDELSDDHRSYVQHSFNSSQTLLKIIQDILDFSKLEAGKLSVVSVAFNIRQAIHEVVDMLALRASNKNLDIIINFPPEMPEHVMGDPGRIRQILVNLITNAINFTNEGGIEINVQSLKQNNDSTDIEIAIRDSGCGIPDEKLATIFERFTQADGSTTRQQQGLGLGLSICKQLLDIMGGSISVQSEQGVGSEFTLRLNLPTSYVSESMRKDILMPMSVLLIDADSKTRNILERLLRYKGMQVDICDSLEAACSHVEDRSQQFRPYDVIMLDYNCYTEDSHEPGNKPSAIDCFKATPVILLGNTSVIREQHSHLGSRFASLLSKPVNPYELSSTLKKLSETALQRHGFIQAQNTQVDTSTSINQKNGPTDNPPHILVVDDNEINVKLAVSALHKMGYVASTAASGFEALSLLKENHYDVILMDILMPEMDGLETTRKIRQYEKDNELPANIILALTAKVMSGDREQCLAAGMNDYLSKPLQLKALKIMLHEWLRKSGKWKTSK